ncbi:hypothetical protein E2C01_065737 [Portunus trituberculatus]|nr:hypothetical protein [Portunus trituberculatus]
MYSVFA